MILIQFHVHQIMILTSIQMTLEESASHPLFLNKRECPKLDILISHQMVRSTLLQGTKVNKVEILPPLCRVSL